MTALNLLADPPSVDDATPVSDMIALLDLYADRTDGAYTRLWSSLVESVGGVAFIGNRGAGDRLHVSCPLTDGDARRPAAIDLLVGHLKAAGHRDALEAQLIAEGRVLMGPGVKRASSRKGKNA